MKEFSRFLILFNIISVMDCLLLKYPSFVGHSTSTRLLSSLQSQDAMTTELSPKSVTKEIMNFFSASPVAPQSDPKFMQRLTSKSIDEHVDGMHVMTILFQCARSRRLAKTVYPTELMIKKLTSWDKMWSERDISTFVYGIRSIEGLNENEKKLMKLGAAKIQNSTAALSSRAIGNALYGLQDITSDTAGAPELCQALAQKIAASKFDISGQDLGIGMYGLQGMNPSSSAEVRELVGALANKVAKSETDLDAQALSNALYGLQSMSSDVPEVRQLVGVLATKVSESSPTLCAQAIGSALYGLQKLSSDVPEVSSLTLASAAIYSIVEHHYSLGHS